MRTTSTSTATRNLTPDDTGIGTWSEEMFVNALKSGKHQGAGRPILPPMPWNWYGQLPEEDLKAMFVYAPDTRIRVHPVKFGAGPWTSVIGEMEGTFSAPMPLPNGKVIPPTGKAFKLSMNTIGRWNAQGTMDEEYLFWDNQTYMQQIGLAQ